MSQDRRQYIWIIIGTAEPPHPALCIQQTTPAGKIKHDTGSLGLHHAEAPLEMKHKNHHHNNNHTRCNRAIWLGFACRSTHLIWGQTNHSMPCKKQQVRNWWWQTTQEVGRNTFKKVPTVLARFIDIYVPSRAGSTLTVKDAPACAGGFRKSCLIWKLNYRRHAWLARPRCTPPAANGGDAHGISSTDTDGERFRTPFAVQITTKCSYRCLPDDLLIVMPPWASTWTRLKRKS